MSTEIKTLFDEISPTYDKLNHFLSFGIDRRWRKKTLDQIAHDKNKKLHVLDLCAGTLDCTLQFLEMYPNSKVTALDFSQNMLDHGVKKIPPKFKDSIKTVCGDGMKPPFSDNSFDAVFCAYGMRNLDNNEQALNELFRVLKPGGVMLILEFFRPQNWQSKFFHATYGKFWLPLMGGLISGKRSAYEYLHSSIQKYFKLEDFEKIAISAGFEKISAKNFMGGVTSYMRAEKP